MLICDRVYDELRNIVPTDQVEPRGDVTLRGRAQPINVYNLKVPLPAHPVPEA